MKTSFFKKTFPALAIMLAVGGAFGTYAMNQSKSASSTLPGYIKNNPNGTSCTLSTDCSNIFGQVCTVNDNPVKSQLYGMDGSKCTVEVYRITP